MKTLLGFLSLGLLGCASEPLTFQQQMALQQASVGLQNAGAIIAQGNRYQQPIYVQPLYQPHFESPRIDTAYHPFVPIPAPSMPNWVAFGH